LDSVPVELRGAVVAIGNFDGCHLGHQRVLAAAREAARVHGEPALVLTFEPHPRDVFAPEPFMFRLCDADGKARLVEALGFDGIVIMPFDRDLAAVEAQDFVSRFLVGALEVKGVVVGADFHFGRQRKGTPAFLAEAGERYGFSVSQLDILQDEREPVSSSRIREALSGGDVDLANYLLGYHWRFDGKVIDGDHRGRELGYPTANIAPAPNFALAHGVYAVRAKLSGRVLDGVASFGKPMFGDASPPFEVHLFDFDEQVYGQYIEIALVGFVRGQIRFDGLDALIAQMDEDSAKAKQMIAAAAPISELDRKLGLII
jgi:riboflavin kinase / FMN adenylyltransferase